MDIVYALKRQGRTLYGFGGERTAVSRKRTQEEKENEAVEKEARRLAFQANQRGQATPSSQQRPLCPSEAAGAGKTGSKTCERVCDTVSRPNRQGSSCGKRVRV